MMTITFTTTPIYGVAAYYVSGNTNPFFNIEDAIAYATNIAFGNGFASLI